MSVFQSLSTTLDKTRAFVAKPPIYKHTHLVPLFQFPFHQVYHAHLHIGRVCHQGHQHHVFGQRIFRNGKGAVTHIGYRVQPFVVGAHAYLHRIAHFEHGRGGQVENAVLDIGYMPMGAHLEIVIGISPHKTFKRLEPCPKRLIVFVRLDVPPDFLN